MHIRNPVEWSVDQVKSASSALGQRAGHRHEAAVPEIRRISLADIRYALARGIDDFAAFRGDVVFLVFIYPLAGLVLARLIFGYGLLPLLFPLASGFALIGPIAAVGLYEMSRRREAGSGGRLGRCLRRVPFTGNRLDRAVWAVAACDLRGLDRRRECDLRFDPRAQAAGLRVGVLAATCSRPTRVGQ